MAQAVERQCTVLLPFEKAGTDEASELASQLEKGDLAQKSTTMKKIIKLMLNGEPLSSLLMFVIRFVIPADDHNLKKLVYLYLEVVDKVGSDGKLLPEMILVCNVLRNDLTHANEFVRGCSLRFLSKLKEAEILEPLVPSIRQNLEHRHSYVRRNAVLAIYNAYRISETLVLDAPELIENFLHTESDSSAKRNAFIMLVHCAQDRAVSYVLESIDQIGSLQDIVQLVMLELVRKVCRAHPAEKSKYMHAMIGLLGSQSNSVTFECCGTLVSLSSNAVVVRAATQSFCQLLCHHSDNNVKLIVLDRLFDLKKNHTAILQECLMDILRGLSSPNVDIRAKILDLTVQLLNGRNIGAVVGVLKKEVLKTQSEEQDKTSEYRQLLIQTIHSCVLKFPEVTSGVVNLLMDFISDSSVILSGDVINFVREVIHANPCLRESIIRQLLDSFFQIRVSRVLRVAMWILSHYCATEEEEQSAIAVIRQSLGDLPFAPSVDGDDEHKTNVSSSTSSGPSRPAVLADGTYATQSAAESSSKPSASTEGSTSIPTLRSLIMGGDFFIATCAMSALTKLVIRSAARHNADRSLVNSLAADVMYYICGIIRFGQSAHIAQGMDNIAHERLYCCLSMLADPYNAELKQMLLDDPKDAFNAVLAESAKSQPKKDADLEMEIKAKSQVDDLLNIRQLRGRQAGGSDSIDDDDSDLIRATGAGEQEEDFAARLRRVMQLTGLSDPVYAEAVVTVHQYDIVLDVLLINQTDETLHNVCLELATVGDLKLCERPQNYTLAAHEQRSLRANIKVSSTETGIIYGNIVFETSATSSAGRNIVILTDIHIDIMDYISPASCSDLQFRIMWAEFEWENKVAILTSITDPVAYLQHIIASTNMRCQIPLHSFDPNCDFLAANLYAKSIFGEDALANLSLERQKDGTLAGSVRIRSKTQGIALSLGDKITLKQKGPA